MRSLAFVALVVFAATCGPDPNAELPGFVRGNGGSDDGVGGSTGTGGTPGDGGSVSGGGRGQGGSVAVGGRSGAGGKVGTGGSAVDSGRGGSTVVRDASAGGAGSDGSGGRTPFGNGGTTGGERDASTVKDAPVSTPDVSGACISQVVANDYACGSASCAACKDQNGASKEAGCVKAIDCLAKAGASCDNNCQLGCLNQAGDTPAQACVTALQKAACGAGGCGATVAPNGGG